MSSGIHSLLLCLCEYILTHIGTIYDGLCNNGQGREAASLERVAKALARFIISLLPDPFILFSSSSIPTSRPQLTAEWSERGQDGLLRTYKHSLSPVHGTCKPALTDACCSSRRICLREPKTNWRARESKRNTACDVHRPQRRIVAWIFSILCARKICQRHL